MLANFLGVFSSQVGVTKVRRVLSRDFPLCSPTKSPLQWVLGLFAGGKAAGSVALITHPHLVSTFRSTAILVLTLWVFMASDRVNFTLCIPSLPGAQNEIVRVCLEGEMSYELKRYSCARARVCVGGGGG
jgi:hypothetical protein